MEKCLESRPEVQQNLKKARISITECKRIKKLSRCLSSQGVTSCCHLELHQLLTSPLLSHHRALQTLTAPCPVLSPDWGVWMAATTPASRHSRAADMVEECMVTLERDRSRDVCTAGTKALSFKQRQKDVGWDEWRNGSEM